MKKICFLFTVSAVLILICGFRNPSADVTDGVYFIVNVETGEALNPVDAGVNSNVRLKDFKKGGMQKWTLKKRTTTGKNGRQIITYTIKHTSSGFFLRPYHIPDNGGAIISTTDSYGSFTIEADEENYIIKNIKMGGDALYVKNGGALPDEPWFGPDDNTDGYRWQLIPENGAPQESPEQ